MAAAAEEAVAAEDTAAGGVGPGVAGEPREVISGPLCPLPFPLAPPFPLEVSVGCEPELKPPPELEPPSETPTPLPPLPPPPLEEPPELPLSRFWLRSFSSRRHFARRFENQTYHKMRTLMHN